MKCDERTLLLYAVTDRHWTGRQTLAEQVRECLEGGATMIQLREKEMEEDAFEKEAEEIKAICREYGVPFIVNDNVEVAMRCGADGVHVGQRDMEAGEVRKKIGSHRILGVSAQTVEQAVLAQQRGADYLGVGSVFPTSTKLDADAVSLETLRQICAAVSIPVVAIGGITEENVTLLKGSGIAGAAVVSAVFGAPDIRLAAGRLKEKLLPIAAGSQERRMI